MLGPSILMFSPPFATGYAVNAALYGAPKVPARVGLLLAGLELVLLIALLIVSVIA
jgi:hypothetical protein